MSETQSSRLLERTEEQNQSTLLLSLENVSVSYDGIGEPIVQNINFSIHEGESVLFLGPSGCGKSTLAMLCGGLIPGSVEANVTGQVWHRDDVTLPGRIGYVFQNPDAQFCMLNVADEIAFGLENVSTKRDRMDALIAKSLQAVHLDVPFAANHASFSGGMKQKLAIASALALHPSVFIFDEPTANLDPYSTSLVFHQIASFRKSRQTMIVIEHKFDQLVPLMDTVVLFDHDGRIHRTGKAKQVVTEEWAWMVNEGIVEPWQRPICAAPTTVDVSPLNGSTSGVRTGNTRNTHQATSASACHLERATAELEKKAILNDMSLDIHEGEFVAVLGPNGAGKSTLLQLMAGLIRPKNGDVLLFGQRASRLSRKARQVRMAYCFQNPEFQFIYDTVRDELANRRTGNQTPVEVVSLLSKFGLSGTEMQSPFSLSQGQKRRLSVAAMLRESHDIFFLDEPTFGQDASTKETIMEKLDALNQDGKTVVMTTHDLELARRFATKVVVVIDGRIRFTGSFAELEKDKALQNEAHLTKVNLQANSDDFVAENVRIPDSNPVLHLKNKTGSNSVDPGHPVVPKRPVFPGHFIVPPVKYLHPVWLLISLVIVTGITLQAGTLSQSLATIVFALIVMLALGFMTPWKIGKLTLPFVVFYVIYVWSFAANAAVPAGTKSFHVLWMNISMYGLTEGIILAFRMLSSVLLGIFYILNMDMSDLMVGLSKDFRVPPKFAYGTLAGLRVVPLFTGEWTKLRQARQLRGKDARYFFLRPITYSIPLLSQAIRMSERVAIAMEARGFTGRPATSGRARTYYRELQTHGWDFITGVLLIVCAFLCVRVF